MQATAPFGWAAAPGAGAGPRRPPHAAALVPSQVSVPPGALDCWVFLSCLEVLQRIEGCCDRAHLDIWINTENCKINVCVRVYTYVCVCYVCESMCVYIVISI